GNQALIARLDLAGEVAAVTVSPVSVIALLIADDKRVTAGGRLTGRIGLGACPAFFDLTGRVAAVARVGISVVTGLVTRQISVATNRGAVCVLTRTIDVLARTV